MAFINKQDTDGTKGNLSKGEFGLDVRSGNERVFVGLTGSDTGSSLAWKSEIDNFSTTLSGLTDTTITTPSSGQVLYYNGSGWINYNFSGSPLVESPTGTYTLTGDLIVTGDVTSLSDEREKENIESVTSALDIVQSIDGVYFNMKDNPEKRHVGVIAQTVQKVLPEAVIDENDRLSVAYGNIVGVLIEAIKELKAEIETLKGV